MEALEQELEEVRAQVRAARAETERAARLSELGVVAAGIAHELRQPLSAMRALAYSLRGTCREGSGLSGPPAARAALQLDRLDTQISEAEEIISHLAEYIRTQRPLRSAICVNECVQHQLAGIQLPEGVRVESRLAAGLPRVLADRVHIERALANLLRNGAESMPEGGALRVDTYQRDDRVVIQVSDDGPGVPEDLRDKLFRPGFSTRCTGLGLGLALARHLVAASGGSIEFQSPPDGGATFLITLPTS